MTTPLSDVYDLFMQIVTDYRLIDLYSSSEEDFEVYLQAWLNFAINDFYSCDQDLTYDESTNCFDESLSSQNKVVLAHLMAKWWLQKVVSDVTQMNLHITDRDFKMASEAQNLREKASYLNSMKETCSQLLNDYYYQRVDWDSWLNQDFAGV